MKMTKRIVAMTACAVMACSVMVGEVPAISHNLTDFSTNAAITDSSTLYKATKSTLDSKVVQIIADYGDKYTTNRYSYSTGFIIGNHTIATCAHGLYKAGRGYPVKVNILFKQNGTERDLNLSVTYDSATKNILVHSDYISDQSGDYDLGVITTKRDISSYGKFALNTNYTPDKKNYHTYTVKGYPMERGYSEYHNYQCYSSGDYKSSTTTKLRYYASTLEGMSGSPVLYDGNAVAINTGNVSNSDTTYNYGVRTLSWFSDKIS